MTSPSTGERLSEDYDVPPENITVAPPGTDRGAPAKGSTDGTLRLLSVGAVVPRKGFDILIAALAPIAELPWRLTIAGDLTRDQATAAKLVADIAQHGLAGRVDLLGALPHERLTTLYSSADIFVLASHFEGYGMAYAEAMAHGLPVIGTTGGATADTVPPNAGVLVDPGNVKALTRALRMLIEDEKARALVCVGRARCVGRSSDVAGHGPDRGGRARGSRMSGFSAEWLKLREPYDLRARNTAVLDAVVDLLAGQPSVAIVDLACGTGSTFRALSPRIKARQNWRLVDNDLSLLARVPPSSPGITVTAAPVDLNRDLEAAFDGPADLVTTSALLDLVSSRLAESACGRSRGAPAARLRGAELRRPRGACAVRPARSAHR